jgi:serine-type D-Ala-D-Ala carboxypeptidase (penicillin-binding protein 5/6)
MRARFYLMGLAVVLAFALTASAATKKHSPAGAAKKHTTGPVVSSAISRDPYIGAIVVETLSGRVLFSDNANGTGYPASVVKLMDLLIILEKVREGTIKLTDTVTVTAEATKIGGSKAYLKNKETFSIDDLLYALMVKSANDAGTALAIHVAGSQEAFVRLMNRKAQELGMTMTHFHSVHGLTTRRGQSHDESTARDLSILARALLKYPDTLRYTSTERRAFRNGTFNMSNHNHLLGVLEGCDGLKTGYFFEAGFSIVATAKRNNNRLIAVVLGSKTSKMRDRTAKELLAEGFLRIPPPILAPTHVNKTNLTALTNGVLEKKVLPY